jgi:hypothetical protein
MAGKVESIQKDALDTALDEIAPKNLRDKLARIRQDCPNIEKKGTAPEKMGGYSYMKAEDICGEIGDRMAMMGISMVPTSVKLVLHEVIDNRAVHVILIVTYLFLDAGSDEQIVVESCGEGRDYGDKATNKALTGAKKYALSQALTLRIGEDSEADAGGDTQAHGSAATNGATATPAPTQPTGGAAPYTPPRGIGPVISDAQGKRLYAIAKGNRDILTAVCQLYGYIHSKEIQRSHYNAICTEVERRLNTQEPITDDPDIPF